MLYFALKCKVTIDDCKGKRFWLVQRRSMIAGNICNVLMDVCWWIDIPQKDVFNNPGARYLKRLLF